VSTMLSALGCVFSHFADGLCRAQAPSSFDRKMIQQWNFRIEATGSISHLDKRQKLGVGARTSTLCERQFRAAIYDSFRVMILLAMR
jgi:hypothetical protein